MLSDDEVLDAVRRHIQGGRAEQSVARPDASALTWQPLLEGKIVRCIETRTEEERFHAGPLDLSDRPVYKSTISRHHVPPPKDPSERSTLKLVRGGSVDDRVCDCGNGQVTCQRCTGKGGIPCEPSRPCTDCHHVDSCLRCSATGSRPTRRPVEGTTEIGRVQCRQCGAHNAACPTCHGRGTLRCTTCRGTGSRACPDCGGDGTVWHRRCEGTGRTVTWTEGVITRKPRTHTVRLPESGVPCLARRRVRRHGTWTQTNLTGQVHVRDHVAGDLTPTLRALLLPHDQEIARHATLRYIRLARVAVPEHPHRIYFVFPAPEGPHVLVLPSRRRTRQITALMLGVLVLAALIARLIA